jgi:Tol biopolymer transport system component
MNADGTNPRKIADWGGTVTWSPDGHHVAYIAPVNKEGIEGKLYVVDIDRLESREIATCDIGRPFDLFWLSTDEITYRQNGVIHAVKSDGSQTRQLNKIFSSNPVVGPSGETLPPMFQGYYRISPDSKKIAYLKTGLPPTLWISNLDGTNAFQVKGRIYTSANTVAWSPDSSRLAYSVYNDKGRLGTDLWVANADGTDFHCVAKPEYEDVQFVDPVWSPDSKVIAFTHRVYSDTEYESVWVVNADTTNSHLLIDVAFAPQWSAMGNEIAVLRRQVIGSLESLLVSVDLGQ